MNLENSFLDLLQPHDTRVQLYSFEDKWIWLEMTIY